MAVDDMTHHSLNWKIQEYFIFYLDNNHYGGILNAKKYFR